MIIWYESEGNHLNAIERVAVLHAIFVGIHPFIDGKGRKARRILTLAIMKDGYPPVISKIEN